MALGAQGVYALSRICRAAEETQMTHARTAFGTTDSGHGLAKRLDNIGWALFFLMTGAVWLIPEGHVPPGKWLIGTGILLLGLNGIRALVRVRTSDFGTILGTLALAAGLSAFWGIRLPIAAIGLIVLGLALLGREMFAGHE
jgi:hypothetical protein